MNLEIAFNRATYISEAINEVYKTLIIARRNKYIGEWASKILGYNTDQEKDYIQSVIKADFAEAGDEDVFIKIKADLKNNNISDSGCKTYKVVERSSWLY